MLVVAVDYAERVPAEKPINIAGAAAVARSANQLRKQLYAKWPALAAATTTVLSIQLFSTTTTYIVRTKRLSKRRTGVTWHRLSIGRPVATAIRRAFAACTFRIRTWRAVFVEPSEPFNRWRSATTIRYALGLAKWL